MMPQSRHGGVQLNAFESASIATVNSAKKEEWTETYRSFRVVVNAKMKPEAQNTPLPNFGWENGQNVKWIDLIKINGTWKIMEIASGP